MVYSIIYCFSIRVYRDLALNYHGKSPALLPLMAVLILLYTTSSVAYNSKLIALYSSQKLVIQYMFGVHLVFLLCQFMECMEISLLSSFTNTSFFGSWTAFFRIVMTTYMYLGGHSWLSAPLLKLSKVSYTCVQPHLHINDTNNINWQKHIILLIIKFVFSIPCNNRFKFVCHTV